MPNKDDNASTVGGIAEKSSIIALTERCETEGKKVDESFEKVLNQLDPLNKKDPFDEVVDTGPQKKKSFKEKITETKSRRNKLMQMMEDTLKSKFDDALQDEAFVVEGRHKKK